MLVNSNSAKGRCPICGAANSACGGPSKLHEARPSAPAAPLRRYPLGRGLYVQLTDEAARARGLLPEEKRRDSAPNKKRTVPNTKARR